MATPALRARAARRRSAALYCTIHGSGTPLLLLHGLGATGAIFQPLIPALAERFQVIVPDLRGHGQSSCLPGPDSIERMAADLENLLDLLGVPACFVLGYASGGAVAQQLARSCPQRVRGLVLVCSYARPAATLGEQVRQRLRPELFRLLGPRNLGALAARSTPLGAAQLVRDVMGANQGGRVAPVARALLAFDSRSWLPALACPALVLAGERDTLTPAHHARELAGLLPNAELRTLPQAGHWLVSSHSADLLAALTPWLVKHEVRA